MVIVYVNIYTNQAEWISGNEEQVKSILDESNPTKIFVSTLPSMTQARHLIRDINSSLRWEIWYSGTECRIVPTYARTKPYHRKERDVYQTKDRRPVNEHLIPPGWELFGEWAETYQSASKDVNLFKISQNILANLS